MARFLGRAGLALALATALFALLAGAAAADELPSCAEGPERVGGEVLGTPCADTIVAPPTATAVYGGPGDDVIRGDLTTAQSGEPAGGLHLEVGSQTFEGGPGNDVVYGDRGNDRLGGNGGADRLYGGIGDDTLEGGEGDDLLSGGFGADRIDGQAGNDYVRGDATIDRVFDSGGGLDTLSFATGATPGFTAKSNPTGAAGFPDAEGERGVWLDLGAGGVNASDGEPSLGGGNDEVQQGAFERIVGTPFSDYIVGSGAGEEIWGGGGADAIEGGGGPDQLHGGGEGDFIEALSSEASIYGEGGSDNCVGAAAPLNCEGAAKAVTPRAGGTVSVGETTAAPGLTQVYVVGSDGGDDLEVSYAGSGKVEISGASFDTSLAEPGRCTIAADSASCPVAGLLDAVLLAGMDGEDSLLAAVPDGVGVVELGGVGGDVLNGSLGEDVLVDGEGASADGLAAASGDDALTHNGGADFLDGGVGSDLFLSVSICDGGTISGGAVGANDRDNASWARLDGSVDARIDQLRAGAVGAGDEPACPGGGFDALSGIEDLEGSNGSDVLYGDEGANQLLGHRGEDTYHARGGNDNLLANSGSRDRVIDCGPGSDQAVIDLAAIGDPAPVECELLREGAPNEFAELPLLSEPPPPSPPPPPPPPPPPVDRTRPQTKLLRHPAKVVRVAAGRRKLLAFRFGASEAARFQCRLDRGPFAGCRSPRRFRLGPGRHAFGVRAVDAAGNRDRTPALFKLRIVAVQRHDRHRRRPPQATR